MRSISTASVITGALVFVLASTVTSPPAEAGPACNRLRLGSPCIKSNDLKARINLRESGKDGRLLIKDADNKTAVALDGSSANVTNLFSNDENASNGLVKAWAQIDFTPLATDITGRPRLATIDDLGVVVEAPGFISLADRGGDPSSIFVNTINANGAESDRAFILIIY